MDYKEGAVKDYKVGWRAYKKINGTLILMSPGGVENDIYNHRLMRVEEKRFQQWHALRAYQDEQRKKGVPITIKAQDINSWMELGYGPYSFSRGMNGGPIIWAFPCDLFPPPPKGVVLNATGRFTNFRWREGYPKGGTHAGV